MISQAGSVFWKPHFQPASASACTRWVTSTLSSSELCVPFGGALLAQSALRAEERRDRCSSWVLAMGPFSLLREMPRVCWDKKPAQVSRARVGAGASGVLASGGGDGAVVSYSWSQVLQGSRASWRSVLRVCFLSVCQLSSRLGWGRVPRCHA